MRDTFFTLLVCFAIASFPSLHLSFVYYSGVHPLSLSLSLSHTHTHDPVCVPLFSISPPPSYRFHARTRTLIHSTATANKLQRHAWIAKLSWLESSAQRTSPSSKGRSRRALTSWSNSPACYAVRTRKTTRSQSFARLDLKSRRRRLLQHTCGKRISAPQPRTPPRRSRMELPPARLVAPASRRRPDVSVIVE